MQELVSDRTADLMMKVLAIAGPVVGLAIGVIVSALRKTGVKTIWKGLAVGSLGILNWILWRIYNAVTNQLGLSSVANLLAQLGMFVVIGIAAGLLYITFYVKPKRT